MIKKSKMLQEVDKLVNLNGLPDEISLVQSNKSSYYVILMFGESGVVVNEIKYYINAKRVKKDIEIHLNKRVD